MKGRMGIIGFAIFNKSEDGRIQGYAAIYDKVNDELKVVRCYPHRDSSIKEGVVALDRPNKYEVKEKDNGTKYIFVKGANDTTSDISVLSPLNIKRRMFEAAFLYDFGQPVFNSSCLHKYRVGDAIVYVSEHTAYAVINNQLYMMGNDRKFIEKLKKYILGECEGTYEFNEDENEAFNITNKLIDMTADKIEWNDSVKNDAKDLTIFLRHLGFPSAYAAFYNNRLLADWTQQRKKDCLPFVIIGNATYNELLKEIIKDNKEEAFRQFMQLEDIYNKRIKEFCDRLCTRVQDRQSRIKALHSLRTYFRGSKILKEIIKREEWN